MSNNSDKLDKILIKFLFSEPFFTSIIRSMVKVKTYDIPTAGVTIKGDSLYLYWNPEFLDTLTTKQCFGLLKHECYHLIFKHIIKRKHDPHLIWNIATDLAINSIIPYRELPKGGFVPGKPLKIPISGLSQEEIDKRIKMSDFIESLPVDKSSEWYMNKILDEQEVSDMMQECFSGQAGEGGENCPGFDYHFEPEIGEGEESLVDAKVKDIVGKALKEAKKSSGWGSVSNEVKKLIESEYSEKAVNWKDVLRNFCGTKMRANKSRSFRKINRKYPYIHPGRKTSHTSSLAIYIDQSGSVSDNEIDLLFSNLNELAKRTSFTVFFFDTSVDEKSKFKWNKRKKIKKASRTRSGGTNFNSVEKFHRTIQSQFDGYMILSDGECFKPDACKTKRCWVLLPGKQLYFTPDKRDAVVQMEIN